MNQPSIKTIKILFAKSGNQCAFPGCKDSIVEDSGTVTGHICHIRARNANGPRYDSKVTVKKSYEYDNLILLCSRHHQIIDKNPLEYRADVLIEMKKIHEEYNGRKELPEDGKFVKLLLNDFKRINITNNTGNIIINSPNAIQTNNLNIKSIKENINILPPPNSIGSDPLLKQRILTLYNKIGQEREKRFPDSGWQVLAKNFKSDFGIKNNKWTIIWTYPIACASSIIDYLEAKYANTIQGRKDKAWSKESYMPPRNILYAKESELLSQLGLTTKSNEVKDMIRNFFGAASHTQLSTNQHWQFVKYLEAFIKNKYD